MKKIKVLHLVEALGGGVYSYFVDLSNFFGNRDDIETYIAYSDKRNEIIPEKIFEDINKNVKLIKIPINKEISPVSDTVAIYQFHKIINSVKPDVIHLHSSKAGVIGRLSYFFSLKCHAKLFYTPHGYSFLRTDISKFKRKVFSFIERNMSNFFGGITIACGDTEFEYSKKIGESLLVRNGVNIPYVNEHNTPNKTQRLTVGILGRITFARNPEMFNEIALRLDDLNFLWIGDGELNNVIKAKNVNITGWFADRKIGLSYLNKIDIYLQTSEWEGLPISLIEAMTLEKPIIATNIIGNRDLITHGVNGFLFQTVDECVEYINTLRNEKLRMAFGKSGRKIVEEKFNLNKNFESLAQIYLS